MSLHPPPTVVQASISSIGRRSQRGRHNRRLSRIGHAGLYLTPIQGKGPYRYSSWLGKTLMCWPKACHAREIVLNAVQSVDYLFCKWETPVKYQNSKSVCSSSNHRGFACNQLNSIVNYQMIHHIPHRNNRRLECLPCLMRHHEPPPTRHQTSRHSIQLEPYRPILSKLLQRLIERWL